MNYRTHHTGNWRQQMSTESKLPSETTIGGRRYSIREREGTIIFTEANPIYGRQTIFRFWREDSAPAWRMSIHGAGGIWPSHITEAYRMIIEAYGDGYGRRGLCGEMREVKEDD